MINISQYIENLQSIKLVQFIQIPSNMFFRSPPSENILWDVGCIYSSKDNVLISQIKEIVKRGNLVAIENHDYDFNSKYDIHEGYGDFLQYGVFLTLSDNTVVKLLFNTTIDGQIKIERSSIGGEFNHSSSTNYVVFSALDTLIGNLQNWQNQSGISVTRTRPNNLARCD